MPSITTQDTHNQQNLTISYNPENDSYEINGKVAARAVNQSYAPNPNEWEFVTDVYGSKQIFHVNKREIEKLHS